MPTTKPRLNLSLPDDINAAIKELAIRDNIPAATKAQRLIETALEIEEDQIWNKIATDRDKNNSKYYTHEAVFGEV